MWRGNKKIYIKTVRRKKEKKKKITHVVLSLYPLHMSMYDCTYTVTGWNGATRTTTRPYRLHIMSMYDCTYRVKRCNGATRPYGLHIMSVQCTIAPIGWNGATRTTTRPYGLHIMSMQYTGETVQPEQQQDPGFRVRKSETDPVLRLSSLQKVSRKGSLCISRFFGRCYSGCLRWGGVLGWGWGGVEVWVEGRDRRGCGWGGEVGV